MNEIISIPQGPLEIKSLLEAAKSDDDDEKIGENDEAKKEFEDIVVDVSSTKVIHTRCGHVVRDFESEAKTRKNF